VTIERPLHLSCPLPPPIHLLIIEPEMGVTTVEVLVHNPEKPAECRTVKLLAGTGAMYSIIPRHILDDLGIEPRWRRKFSLGAGQRIERDGSGALYRIGEYEGHAPVIFGEEGDHPILGVTALEAMGLQVDPVTHELKPTELLLL
jgi:aspartyl protease family protein